MHLITTVLFASILLTISTLHAATTPLTRAIRLEKFDEAKKYLTPQLVNKPDDGGYKPLTYAVYTGNNKFIEALLKAGAKTDIVEANGKTPLYVAANFNNVKAIKLLHQYGATYPPKNNPYQPAKIAVKNNALDALKALCHAYPNIDLNAGWKKPNVYSDGSFRSGGALNEAARYGYNEMALFLLTKKVNLQAAQSPVDRRDYNVPASRGKKALHNAAQNRKCSLKLVKALIQAGCDPFECTPGIYLMSRTPLEYAAEAGSLEKVKILLGSYNPKNKKHHLTLERALFIASANNHKRIVKHLLSVLGVPRPNLKKWIADHKDRVKARGSLNPIHEEHLRILMPRSKPNVTAQKALGTLAVIASQSLQNTASLLSAELSTSTGIHLLERDALTQILQETTLKNFQNNTSQSFHKSLELIPAEYLVLINKKELKSGSLIELVTINSVNSVVLSRLALSKKQSEDPAYIKQYVSFITNHLVTNQNSTTTAVTLTSIKPEIPTPNSLAQTHTINTSLPFFVSNTNNCVLLTRTQLHHLETEKAIGAQGTYWKAAWLIDGGIKINDDTHTTITLRATNTRDNSKIIVTNTTDPKNITAATKSAWIDLVKKLNISPSKSITKKQLPNEAKLLTESAQWFLQANYITESITYANAALTLGAHNQKIYSILLRAQLKKVPLAIVNPYVSSYPRILKIEKKFFGARHIPDYLTLANTCIEYANYVDKQLITSSLSRRRSKVYNELIRRTLRRLLFFRTLIDDIFVKAKYGDEIKALDAKIKQLTNIYLKLIRGKELTVEIKSILGLMRVDWNFYYDKHMPEMLQQNLMRVKKLIMNINSRRYYSGELVDLAYSKIKHSRWEGYSAKIWLSLFKNPSPKSGLTSKVRLFAKSSMFESNPKKRAKLQTLALSYAITSAKNDDVYTPSYRPSTLEKCKCLTGSEYTIEPQSIIGLPIPKCIFNVVPQGTILMPLDVDPASLLHTAELRRLWGLYLWRETLKKASNKTWEEELIKYQNSISKFSEKYILTPADWVAFRKIYKQNRKPSISVIALLNKLADKTTSIKEKDHNVIVLKNSILIPKFKPDSQLGAFIQSQSITIIGNEAWIPTTYIEPKRVNPEDHKKHFVIHVINLETKKIETIPLPDILAHYNFGSSRKKIFVADDYIYYRSYGNRSLKLYAIHRKTHKVVEVKLPLPCIVANSFKIQHNTLCLSVSAPPNLIDSKAYVNNQVVLIKGAKIIATLVSNQRTPALSPLDKPKYLITLIDHKKDSIVLISNHTFGYMDADQVAVAVYNIKSKKWKTLPWQQSQTLRNQYFQHCQKIICPSLALQSHGATYYMDCPSCFVASSPYLYITLSKKHILSYFDYSSYMAPGPGPSLTGSYNRKIKVQANLQSSPLFKRKITNYKVRYYKEDGHSELIDYGSYKTRGWWYSPNEIIQKELYSVRVVGFWKDQAVLSLFSKGMGLPAIWMVPKKAIMHHLINNLREVPPPLSFNHLKVGAFDKIKYPHLTITSKGRVDEILKKYGIENSQTLALIGRPNFTETIITAQGVHKDGFSSLSAFARRGSKKSSFQFRIDIWINGAWKEFYNGDKLKYKIPRFPNITLKFPEKIKKFRFRVKSNKFNCAIIDDLFFE